MSGIVLALATIVGVHLGLDGPAVSPVSPPAIAARYGTPPPEVTTAPPSSEEVGQTDAGQTTKTRHQRDQRSGGGHD